MVVDPLQAQGEAIVFPALHDGGQPVEAARDRQGGSPAGPGSSSALPVEPPRDEPDRAPPHDSPAPPPTGRTGSGHAGAPCPARSAGDRRPEGSDRRGPIPGAVVSGAACGHTPSSGAVVGGRGSDDRTSGLGAAHETQSARGGPGHGARPGRASASGSARQPGKSRMRPSPAARPTRSVRATPWSASPSGPMAPTTPASSSRPIAMSCPGRRCSSSARAWSSPVATGLARPRARTAFNPPPPAIRAPGNRSGPPPIREARHRAGRPLGTATPRRRLALRRRPRHFSRRHRARARC